MPLDDRNKHCRKEDHQDRIPHHLPSFNPMPDLVYTDDINDTLRGTVSDDLPNAQWRELARSR
eukprot:9014213-Prorocentrum_lima.AAC.1